jgi:hypothetical protein
MTHSSSADLAAEVLSLTEDGNILSSFDLRLVELAANGNLNENGIARLEAIALEISTTGSYTAPAFCGVPNLTRDGEGYVYWKGTHVEHFSHSDQEAMVAAAIALGERCQHLESLGVAPSSRTAAWTFEWFADLTPGHEWIKFFEKGPTNLYEDETNPNRICAQLGENTLRVWENGTHSQDIVFTDFEVAYHVARAEGFKTLQAGQAENLGLIYAPAQGIIDRLTAAGLSPEIIRG